MQSALRLALGVATDPSCVACRRAIRDTYLHDVPPAAVAKFFAGDVACAHDALDDEAGAHADIVFVRSPDCNKWYSAEKTHAWFRHALQAYPSAVWIGKTEDDALLSVEALLGDLARLDPAQVDIYGPMMWGNRCTRDAASGDALGLPCSFCYAGSWQRGPFTSPVSAPSCRRGCSQTGRACVLNAGTPSCPHKRSFAFAWGGLEVRSRRHAAAIAGCGYADAFMANMSARATEMCAATDEAQGHVADVCASAASASVSEAAAASASASPRPLTVAHVDFRRVVCCPPSDHLSPRLQLVRFLAAPPHAATAADRAAPRALMVHPIKLGGGGGGALGATPARWEQTWRALREAAAPAAHLHHDLHLAVVARRPAVPTGKLWRLAVAAAAPLAVAATAASESVPPPLTRPPQQERASAPQQKRSQRKPQTSQKGHGALSCLRETPPASSSAASSTAPNAAPALSAAAYAAALRRRPQCQVAAEEVSLPPGAPPTVVNLDAKFPGGPGTLFFHPPATARRRRVRPTKVVLASPAAAAFGPLRPSAATRAALYLPIWKSASTTVVASLLPRLFRGPGSFIYGPHAPLLGDHGGGGGGGGGGCVDGEIAWKIPGSDAAGTGSGGGSSRIASVWCGPATDGNLSSAGVATRGALRGPLSTSPTIRAALSRAGSERPVAFSVVRDPLERFVSAYRPKSGLPLCRRHGRDGQPCASVLEGMRETARQLAELRRRGGGLGAFFGSRGGQEHFLSQTYLLTATASTAIPTLVSTATETATPLRLDYVARVESLGADLREIAAALGACNGGGGGGGGEGGSGGGGVLDTRELVSENAAGRDSKEVYVEALRTATAADAALVATLCDLCEAYDNDYACLGYARPAQCANCSNAAAAAAAAAAAEQVVAEPCCSARDAAADGVSPTLGRSGGARSATDRSLVGGARLVVAHALAVAAAGSRRRRDAMQPNDGGCKKAQHRCDGLVASDGDAAPMPSAVSAKAALDTSVSSSGSSGSGSGSGGGGASQSDDDYAVRIVWIFWAQGWAAAPPIVRACAASWRRHNHPRWDVRLISLDEIASLGARPEDEGYRHAPRNTTAHYSDLVRIELLRGRRGRQVGCCWLLGGACTPHAPLGAPGHAWEWDSAWAGPGPPRAAMPSAPSHAHARTHARRHARTHAHACGWEPASSLRPPRSPHAGGGTAGCGRTRRSSARRPSRRGCLRTPTPRRRRMRSRPSSSGRSVAPSRATAASTARARACATSCCLRGAPAGMWRGCWARRCAASGRRRASSASPTRTRATSCGATSSRASPPRTRRLGASCAACGGTAHSRSRRAPSCSNTATDSWAPSRSRRRNATASARARSSS